MLADSTIGTKDLDRGGEFYDALLAEAGAKQRFGTDRIKFYGAYVRDLGGNELCLFEMKVG